MSNRLGGKQGTAYTGTNADQPPNLNYRDRNPNQYDTQNYSVGDLWLNTKALIPWMLVSLQGSKTSRGPLATWIPLTGGGAGITNLEGNTGGMVFGNGASTVFVQGDATTITIGGNPGTNTLTATVGSSVPTTFMTTAGSAIPFNNVINFAGAGGITASAAGSTVTITGSGGTVSEFTTSTDGHIVTPTAGNINLQAGTGMSITGTVGPNRVTIATAGSVAQSFPTDAGTATPNAGVLNIIANVAALNCGSSVEFTAPGTSNTVQLNVTDSLGNTIIGSTSGNATLTSTGSVGLGDGVLTSLTSATNCIAIGNGSGSTLTSGSTNLLIGNGAGSALSGTSQNNLIIGGDTGFSGATTYMSIGVNAPNSPTIIHNYPGQNASTSNGGNVFIGFDSGNFTLTGATQAGNNALGGGSLQDLTSGFANNAMGDFTLRNLTSGERTVALGGGAGYNSVSDTGLTTGSDNVLIGYNAGSAYTSSESNNLILLHQGSAGESGVIRIGTSGNQVKNFQAGIRGVTTANANAIAVLIDSAGQLGTVSSSIRYKENVEDMADSSSPLMKLRPVTFNYKSQGNKDYGLIAEEVAEIFPDLVVYDNEGQPETIKYHILCSILLNELQKQAKRIDVLESNISSS